MSRRSTSPRRGAPAKSRRAPRKLVCLETYWGDHRTRMFHTPSVLPFFEGPARQLDPALAIARRFLKASSCRAVVGYATDIDWMDSMLTDLLFLRRFYIDPDPWENLRAIHASVLADFAAARRLGHVLHLRGD